MDLLTGYGSGSESEQEEAQETPQGRATLLDAAPKPPQPAGAAPASLLSSLPAPAGAQAPLFSGLPKPKRQVKKPAVQFRVPISYGPPPDKLAEEEEEEERTRKRRRAGAQKGASLAALLPPPKNAAAAGGQRLDTAGGGGGGGKGASYDSDDEEWVPGIEDRSGMVDLGPGERAADAGFAPDGGAEVPGGGGASVDAAPEPAGEMHPSEAYRVAVLPTGGYAAHGAAGVAPAPRRAQQAALQHAGADPAEALLAQALAAERARAARHGGPDPFAGGGALPAMKEIRADDVKFMDPAARAEVDAIRNALGADYEASLRAQAGAAPSRLARSRHQIGSLFHQARGRCAAASSALCWSVCLVPVWQHMPPMVLWVEWAKLAELKDMEVRAQSSKTKAESKRKYGW
eukprot:scaffold7.g3398.t1